MTQYGLRRANLVKPIGIEFAFFTVDINRDFPFDFILATAVGLFLIFSLFNRFTSLFNLVSSGRRSPSPNRQESKPGDEYQMREWTNAVNMVRICYRT